LLSNTFNGVADTPMTERARRKYTSQAAGPGRAQTGCLISLAAAGMLLAAGGCSSPSGQASQSPAAGPVGSDCLTQAHCYAPHQFLMAYGIQSLLDHGIDGSGQTVVLPEFAATAAAPRVTDIRQDLARFDSRFGLPPARIQVITTLAGSSDSKWLANVEEVVDTEMVHAVAPDATIRELLVARADVNTPAKEAATFATQVRIAASHADVISLSGAYGEHFVTPAEVATVNSALEYSAARHVTFVAASGDGGAISDLGTFGSTTPVKEVSLPASDPLVLAVGGTTLTANPVTGTYGSETALNTLPELIDGHYSQASGGGFSHIFARPAYQDGVPGIGATRGVPDVAADGSSSTGMAFAFAAPGGGYALVGEGGTSEATPFWAGLIALADQEAGHPLGFVNPAIYEIARGPQYHKAFHDITTGNNTVAVNGVTITGYQAGPGWDPVTGWGSPDAQVLVPLLARYASSQTGPA
jgi:subtilase family serine protease